MGVIKELKERIRVLSSTPELEETKEKLERAVNHDGLREILEEELDIHRSHNKMHLLLQSLVLLGLGTGATFLLCCRGDSSSWEPLYSISRTISLPGVDQGWSSLLPWIGLGIGASAGVTVLISHYDIRRSLKRRLKELKRYIEGDISREEEVFARKTVYEALEGKEEALELLKRNPWFLVVADKILTGKEKDDLVKRLRE